MNLDVIRTHHDRRAVYPVISQVLSSQQVTVGFGNYLELTARAYKNRGGELGEGVGAPPQVSISAFTELIPDKNTALPCQDMDDSLVIASGQ